LHVHDLVIRGGTVVDGTGASARSADVAIDGSLITAVGPNLGLARRVIDASGLLVTPGFVDMHTHYDAQVTWDPFLTPSSWHGVTTVVAGNCGVGFAPAHADRHEWLIELMEGVEDIPGSAMVEGIEWAWKTYPEYLNAVAAKPKVLDYGSQIAHGPLRAYVMGDRGAANEPAKADDITNMALLVEEALRAGALGFSTSRTPIHRSKSGELVPGTTADADELLGIGDALARAGHGVFQFAPEHVVLATKEWSWMRELARRTGRTVSVNVNQTDAGPEVWRDVLSLLDEALLDGTPIVAQAAGRSIGLLMCLDGSLHPLMFAPAYSDIAHLPRGERLAALRDPARRERIITEPLSLPQRFERIFPVDGAIDYEPVPHTDSIAARSAASGTPMIELVLDQLLRGDGTGMLYTPFFNYSYGDLSMTEAMHRHPGTRMGLGDAGAHCGVICDGGMPTFMLTHWTRDRTRGARLPLEYVVRRQTRETAALYGLHDRGVIAPGYKADVNVIDYDHLTFDAPSMAFDFPANGRRLVQRGRGYRATVCTGAVTVEHDEFTGALPGVLLRGPRSGPRTR
jgi:N-acyl-D-amino-acid deacylase